MRRLVSLVLILTAALATGSAQSSATVQIAGLSQPVEILRDRWGINHIYAQNEPDLFFAQGYAAARDRLFQFEIWRRQATGTVAEILGRREVTRDRGARLHQFRGDMDDELNRYHPRGKSIVEAYVKGVNAYIVETERDATLLPMEFRMLGIKPGRWTPAVVISRHQALTSNVSEEVRLLRAIKSSNLEIVRELMTFRAAIRASRWIRRLTRSCCRRICSRFTARSARACSSGRRTSPPSIAVQPSAPFDSQARPFKANLLAQDRPPIQQDLPISMPIHAISDRTTG
jgi:penicillin amidase